MNLFNKTRCYLIGNLQSESENWEYVVNWRKDFSEKVRDMGVITMSPLDKVFVNFKQESRIFQTEMLKLLEEGKLDEVHNEMKSVRRRDLAMIDHSNFIVGVLNAEKPTFGTVEELSFAVRANKPIFLVIQQGIKKVPLWIAGMLKPDSFYNSLDEVLNKLQAIDCGTIPITDENWRLFSDEYNTIQS